MQGYPSLINTQQAYTARLPNFQNCARIRFNFPPEKRTNLKFIKVAEKSHPVQSEINTLRNTQFSVQISEREREREVMGEDGEAQYWLLKTEPGEWSWEDQAANGGVSRWDGVKNKQAQKYMKSMKVGDLCFFYHSGNKARRIVGVVSVTKEWYFTNEEEEEKDNKKDGAVDVKAVGEMNRPVDLKEMKGEDGLKGFVLLKQPRLSVVPVSENVWDRLCEIGGGFTTEEGEDASDD